MGILLEEGIVSLLCADAGLKALVAGRIRPKVMEQQDALPLIVYETVSNTPEYLMGGECGVARARMSFTSWADARSDKVTHGYADCKAVDEALRLVLSGYRGTVTTQNGSVQIDFCELGNRVDLYDPEVARGLAMMAVVSDYTITYRQAKP